MKRTDMTPAQRNAAQIFDIVEACEHVISYVKGKNYQDFETESILQDAVMRRLIMIGESAKLLTTDLRKKTPEIPWSSMAKLKDIITHHYWKIETPIIWSIAQDEVPTWLLKIKTRLAQEDK